MKKYLVLPTNTDLNRGDQALIWNTIELAQRAGFNGEYYMLSEEKELTLQSQRRGINIIKPILKHPGRKFKTKENNEYSRGLLVKWGLVATSDFLKSILLLMKLFRPLGILALSTEDKNTLRIINESDACFIKGGGFIHSAGKLTDTYTIYYLLFHVFLAQSLNKPVYVMPNSFGPFKGFMVEKMVKKALNNCEIVTVRESTSGAMLDNIDVKNELYPDLGFFLNKKQKSMNEIGVIKEQYPNFKLVGITARPYRFPHDSNPQLRYKEYIENMVVFSEWLYANKYLPIFVEHTLSETSHEDDASCIAQIISQLEKDKFKVVGNVEYDCEDLKSIYSEFDYTVGTRFHSVIFSLAEGVPSMAITYGGNKGQGIMKDLGLDYYAISMSHLVLKKL